MARNIVSHDSCNQGSPYPECFVENAKGCYEPNPTAVVRKNGFRGNLWESRATMIKIMLNRLDTEDCKAFLLALAENGDVYVTRATANATIPKEAQFVTGVTKEFSIERVALRLKEAAA